MQRLDEWLADHNAKNIRHEELSNGDMLDWIAINGRVLILQTYAKKNGWDIYRPTGESNLIADTLRELDAWLHPRGKTLTQKGA